ncbi:hypothetical protein [Escherichia coli]|uniref:hypothetical protein n=1 Tax=Escherichia coli TaxID=562 RepID=UPI00388DB9AE
MLRQQIIWRISGGFIQPLGRRAEEVDSGRTLLTAGRFKSWYKHLQKWGQLLISRVSITVGAGGAPVSGISVNGKNGG